MALKAHFAVLAFIVCTSHTSLWSSRISVHTSQRPVRPSQIPLSVRTSQRPVCTSHLLASPCKIKYRCALLKYSTAHFLTNALSTSEIPTAHF